MSKRVYLRFLQVMGLLVLSKVRLSHLGPLALVLIVKSGGLLLGDTFLHDLYG